MSCDITMLKIMFKYVHIHFVQKLHDKKLKKLCYVSLQKPFPHHSDAVVISFYQLYMGAKEADHNLKTTEVQCRLLCEAFVMCCSCQILYWEFLKFVLISPHEQTPQNPNMRDHTIYNTIYNLKSKCIEIRFWHTWLFLSNHINIIWK